VAETLVAGGDGLTIGVDAAGVGALGDGPDGLVARLGWAAGVAALGAASGSPRFAPQPVSPKAPCDAKVSASRPRQDPGAGKLERERDDESKSVM
jgi:hypothetical protein